MTPRPADPAHLFIALDPAADASVVGGKAASLARLRQAGLPTPHGFVLGDGLYRALADDPERAPFPPGFEAQLAAHLAALGSERFSVRSSFAGEDQPGSVAAGVYRSRVGVAAAAVPDAIRAVLASAAAPAARAYAAAHGWEVAAAPVAVLIHTHVAGQAQGAAAYVPGDGAVVVDVSGALSAKARARIEAGARVAAARHGGSELEWVAAGDAVTFLQLRPYTPPVATAPWAGWSELPAEPADARTRTWRWDAAHNPLPLSRAHAGLVALVDRSCRIGLRQRVLGGYLFWADDASDVTRVIAPGEVAATLAELIADATRELGALARPPELEAALALFLRHYEPLLGVVQPAARRARAALQAFVNEHAPDLALPTLLADIPSVEKLRRSLVHTMSASESARTRADARAAYLTIFGDESPAWDIASPTYAEDPRALPAIETSPRVSGERSGEHQRARVRGNAQQRPTPPLSLPPALAAPFTTLLTHARQAIAAGEDDDWIYARLQAPIRHAIRALGATLVHAGALATADDAFDLELDTLRALARGAKIPAATLAVEAARGRAERTAARTAPPPLPTSSTTSADPTRPLRGHGCGGRVVGRVVLRHGPAGHAPPRDAVLVATSLLPTELPLLDVAALVTEAGGPLGHVATQARERHLPAVVGATGAVARLRDGDLVLVDGDAGVVIKTTG